MASTAFAQTSTNPFPAPIEANAGVVAVNFTEFAVIPDADGGEAPRLMHLVDEPGSKRMFVSTMRGRIYSVSYDGKTVTEYLDINAPGWNHPVQFQGSERGFQSFAFHPQFNQRGARGYGRFYTYLDTSNMTPAADFTAADGAKRTHDTVLLEWTAKNPDAPSYDGGAPKELIRVAQPFANHNGGEIAFNPLTPANSPDFGLLYIGSADGGSGGDPMNLAQNLASAFGKILRIDPLGSSSRNGKYGIPKTNPFAGKSDALGEIYAYGVRNPQRFSWDSKDGKMYVADIGQNVVEEISPVTSGANLGWNKWEASYKYVRRQVDLTDPRSEAGLTWPVAEFDHTDALMINNRAAITGVYVYREKEIKPLQNLLIFGDNPSGEIFYVNADKPPNGGQDQIRRILFSDKGTNKTLLQLIREKNAAQGKPPAPRADMRMGRGPRGQIFVLNKRDGVIRLFVP
ncbi:MAG: PQQ-dependent sugar dehydrogenase [Cyanobacteria bacterium]|nr:PQQ-dependent sugar dehydrogenase [Cyanobacteriota bacterium]